MKHFSYRIKYYNNQHKLVVRRDFYSSSAPLTLDHLYSNGAFCFIPVKLVAVYDDDVCIFQEF